MYDIVHWCSLSVFVRIFLAQRVVVVVEIITLCLVQTGHI